MPEYTNNDRQMIEAEQAMWSVATMLDNVQGGGSWRKKIKSLRDQCVQVAGELREYNDQFEVEE